MRTVFLFCLSLFFLLSGRSDAYPGAPDHRIGPAHILHVQKLQQAKPVNVCTELPFIIKNGVIDSRDDSSIENEDDEIEFGSSHSTAAKFPLSAIRTSLLNHFYYYNCFYNYPLFCRQSCYNPTYKYILQRVLRL